MIIAILFALIYFGIAWWSYQKPGWKWKLFTLVMAAFGTLSVAETEPGQWIVRGHQIAGEVAMGLLRLIGA